MTELLKLRRFLDPQPEPPPRTKDVCELCGASLADAHGHVIDLSNRRLMCSCRPCYLLFTHNGAGAGKFRSVPDRYVRIPEAEFRTAWERLDIPVGMAFFIHNSSLSRIVALYPSPAGATEAGLAAETWTEMIQSTPLLATLEPDVEALLVCRQRGRSESWIVPVNTCYGLVGRIRRSWSGLEGGERAWAEIDSFFASLQESAA